MKFSTITIVCLLLTIMSANIFADDASVQTNLNYLWVMVASALVFFMQAGFMCLESGLTTSKNTINVAIKNLADFVIALIVFWAIGFGLMFGKTGEGILSGIVGVGSDFFMDDTTDSFRTLFFVFQAVFVGTAATIDSGAIAGRAKFGSYLIMSAIISAIIYPIFGHWAWGSLLHNDQKGWLEALGFIDFAGSTVVHSVGGWMALVGVIIVGPRVEKFGKDGKPRKIHPSNLTLSFMGTFILFFGWFGFNCGSTLEATPKIAEIAFTTMIAGCFGCVVTSALSWTLSKEKIPEAEMIMNGMLGGLVGITAGCAVTDGVGAAMIGITSGIVVYFASLFIERVLKLDDVVGAIAVHGCCGAWGTIATGIFMTNEALGETSRLHQIGIQSLGVLSCFLWTFSVGFTIMYFLKKTVGMRVSLEHELLGLNISEHGATSSILDLANSMKQVVDSNNYDDIKELEVEIGTEIGDLTNMFNDMIKNIKSQKKLADEQKFIAEDQLKRFDTHMNQSVQAIEGEILKMNEKLVTSMSKAKEVTSSVGNVSDTFNNLSSSLSKLMLLTDEHSKDANGKIKHAILEVSLLSESIKEIKHFATIINAISDQTKLLALNATIEASRAGDAGKGFGVVAGEVKSLSARVNSSTAEIENNVNTISTKSEITKNAINTIQDVMSKIVSNTNELSENTERSKIVNDLCEQTSAVSQEMLLNIQQVQEGVEKVKKTVQDSYEVFKESIIKNKK